MYVKDISKKIRSSLTERRKAGNFLGVTAPYGYELTEEIEFEVTTDKETQRLEMKDMPILKDIRIVKIDKDTKEIIKSDFTFGIYEDENCTKLIKEVKSDKENGYVTFEDLRYGKYYIKEIEAPKGYKLSDKKIIVEINDNGVTIDGNLVQEAEKDLYSFDFENEKIETPNTGDNSNIGFWIKVLSISFILSTSLLLFIPNMVNRRIIHLNIISIVSIWHHIICFCEYSLTANHFLQTAFCEGSTYSLF